MYTQKLALGISVALLALALSGCGESEEEKLEKQIAQLEAELEEKTSNMSNDIATQLTEAIGKVSSGVETVSARELKAVLPETIQGMERTAFSASKQGIKGIGVSLAEATFKQAEGSGKIEISLTDIGSMSGFAALGLDVLDVEIDEENQDGWKRTEPYKGYKSFQSFSKTGSRSQSEMVVFVDGRFVFRIDAVDVDWDVIGEVADGVPLKKLAALK